MCHNTHTHTHTRIRLCTNACAHSKQTHSHICSLVAALSSKLSSLQSSPFVLVSKWPLIRMLVCFKSLFPGTSAISVDYWKSFEEVVLFFSPNAQQILWRHTRVHTHTHTMHLVWQLEEWIYIFHQRHQCPSKKVKSYFHQMHVSSGILTGNNQNQTHQRLMGPYYGTSCGSHEALTLQSSSVTIIYHISWLCGSLTCFLNTVIQISDGWQRRDLRHRNSLLLGQPLRESRGVCVRVCVFVHVCECVCLSVRVWVGVCLGLCVCLCVCVSYYRAEW